MKGIGVSPGISIGRAFVLSKNPAVLTGRMLLNEDEVAVEIIRFDKAVEAAVAEIESIQTNTDSLTDEAIAILETQTELLSDPQIRENVFEKINGDKKDANDALIEVVADLVALFKSMDDEYMQARSADMQDVGDRLLRQLNGSDSATPKQYPPDTIIVAEDISPSDTISMDTRYVTGFATQAGSRTSHAVIVARAKGIPAVVGCGDEFKSVKHDDLLILDGTSGTIHVNPEQSIVDEYRVKQQIFIKQVEILKTLKDQPAITADGTRVTLTANIAGADEMESVFEHGGEGVGLLRTELLFMDRDSFPSEEEQFDFYKKVALNSKGKPVIVRTIDIGGDKHLPYFNLPVEQNPFLGYRAIRICLDRKDLFITQLKAILRAAVFGDLKIMLPMISNVDEVRAAKNILAEAKEELVKDSIPFKDNVPVGIMIEIPSAAITADILAKEVDFFSIGTNDLCQYTLAVDRMNEKISHLYDPFNPGVLRLIANVIEQGHKHDIHVGMCGEMAGDTLATLLLLGMGLREFSMSSSSIPQVKNIILNHGLPFAKEVCDKVMQMDSSKNIISYLQSLI